MARQPSLLSDYISVLLRTIESTKRDPAQLRSLVYELARLSLGKQILTHYNEMGTAGLQKHMLELETAIKQVEVHSRNDTGLLGTAPSAVKEAPSAVNEMAEPLDLDHAALVVREQTEDGDITHALSTNSALLIQQDLSEIYSGHLLPGYLDDGRSWEPAQTVERLPDRIRSKVSLALQLSLAVIAGLAIYVGLVGRGEVADTLSRLRLERLAQIVRPLPPPKAPESQPVSREAALPRAPSLGFDLPTAYGVYAVSAGKLVELDTLPIRVPDSRVAISAMISSPSTVTVPAGKLSFVVFRRDLVTSAPDVVSVRVIARVVRELKFSDNGPAKMSKVDDQWAVRSNAYELRVAPVPNNAEMILLRPQNADFSLPSGRYALVLKGQAYDFTVDGPITDAAQCLERTDAVGGMIYSECRTP
jgi:hypothetical protein